MNSLDYVKAKYSITLACESTGLSPEELVGVLSDVLAEAREQVCFGLAGELLQARDQIKNLEKMIPKEEDDGNIERNSNAEGPRS